MSLVEMACTHARPAGRSRRMVLGAGVAALITATAACGSNSKSTTGTTTAPASGGSATTAAGGGRATTGSGGGSAATGATIKIGYLGDQSGSLASTFSGGVIGAQIFVKYYNDHGGLFGHKLSLSVYDDQSSPSAVLANARLAVEQGAQVLISNDVYFDTAASFLKQKGVPVFGSGITPGFYGAGTEMFFSQEGNWIGFESNAQSKWLVGKGMTKIAVVSDPNPGNSVAAHGVAKGVTGAGGTLIYTNYTVDDTNSASLLALAQRVNGLGAQAVYTNFYGTAPAQLQADMQQIGSKAVVVTGALGVSPAIPQQFGASANNLLSELFSATWLNPQIPGIQKFTAAMQQYSPSNVQNAEALAGWANMVMFAGAIQQLGSKDPTPANIVTAGNAISNYTGDGMFPAVSFPAFHTQANPCMTLAQLQDKQWKIVTGTDANPFACGTNYPAAG